jgi:cytochrome c oxidase cbb3-type subunit IV
MREPIMDINTFRSIMTVVCFIAFLAVVFWAYSPRSARAFEEAARLPFGEDRDADPDKEGSGR